MTTDYPITKMQYAKLQAADRAVVQAQHVRALVLECVLASHDVDDGTVVGCTEMHITVETPDPPRPTEDG